MNVENSIICGDCNKIVDTLEKDSVDLVVTSPPYGELRDYKGYSLDISKLAMQLRCPVKPGGVIVWVVGDETNDGSESGESFKQAQLFMGNGWRLHDTMIYEKNTFAFPSTKESMRYHQQFEYTFIFSKGKPKTFNPIMDKLNVYLRTGGDCKRQKDGSQIRNGCGGGGKPQNKYGMRSNVWKYNIGGGSHSKFKRASEHPATFPDQLVMDHIKSWSNPGDLVLDPMCGSGTTCAMADGLGRNYIGIEIASEYCALTNDRISYGRRIKAGEIFSD
jgi:site-specific DNA-methyltransferase (adenine-specific)